MEGHWHAMDQAKTRGDQGMGRGVWDRRLVARRRRRRRRDGHGDRRRAPGRGPFLNKDNVAVAEIDLEHIVPPVELGLEEKRLGALRPRARLWQGRGERRRPHGPTTSYDPEPR